MNSQEIIFAWNAQADQFNQWSELGEDEKLQWAYELATAHEREQCALVCEEISNDRWAAYKNRPPYEHNETTRYNQHTEGESDGADLCFNKIRARREKP